MASVGAQDYELPDRQLAKLEEIEHEIPMRLELARRGLWPLDRR